MSGKRIADAAQSLVGTPYLLHGRNPEFGLDCVGLVAASLHRAGLKAAAPCGYGLRNGSIDTWLRFFAINNLVEMSGECRSGDVLLTRPGPGQHHLIIIANTHSFIHAHAGLRRVVRAPAPTGWPVVSHWRHAAF